jgi:hypothetical protein
MCIKTDKTGESDRNLVPLDALLEAPAYCNIADRHSFRNVALIDLA